MSETQKHPTYIEMVKTVIIANDSRKGVSRQIILKKIISEYHLEEKQARTHLNLALKKAVANNVLKHPHGYAGSYKVVKEKQVVKKAVKKAIEKKKSRKENKENAAPKREKATKATSKESAAKKTTTKKKATSTAKQQIKTLQKKKTTDSKKSTGGKKPSAKKPNAEKISKKKLQIKRGTKGGQKGKQRK